MDLFRAPQGHWLGPYLHAIPSIDACLLETQFEIVQHGEDISVLTRSEVDYVLFCLSTDNFPLLETALKICVNLNKHLILFHTSQDDIIKFDQSMIIQSIDISSSTASERIKALSLQLSMQQANLTPMDETLTNQQVDTHSGSRIDIFRTLKHIDDNLEKEIKEEELAALCHYSISYFSKLFHNVVGISFRDYLTNKRINHAKHLLTKRKNEKIAAIAYQCGYNDVSYFSRIFKKKTGLTPGNYRKINHYGHSHI